jgi:hypothetical protein
MKNAYCVSGSSPGTHQNSPDFICENHISIFLPRPISPAAFVWIQEHRPEDRQTFGDAVVVEPRYIGSILLGPQDDGLVGVSR